MNDRMWSPIELQGLARYANKEEAQQVAQVKVVGNPFDLRQNKSGKKEIIKTIYNTLKEKFNINYELEKFILKKGIQYIRTPEEILTKSGTKGTCLDLALLFCGLCLKFRLLPWLVLKGNHVFVMVCLSHDTEDWNKGTRRKIVDQFRKGKGIINWESEEMMEQLFDWVDSGEYLPVECTGFARLNAPERSEGYLSFEQSIEVATKQLEVAVQEQTLLDLFFLQSEGKIKPFKHSEGKTKTQETGTTIPTPGEAIEAAQINAVDPIFIPATQGQRLINLSILWGLNRRNYLGIFMAKTNATAEQLFEKIVSTEQMLSDLKSEKKQQIVNPTSERWWMKLNPQLLTNRPNSVETFYTSISESQADNKFIKYLKVNGLNTLPENISLGFFLDLPPSPQSLQRINTWVDQIKSLLNPISVAVILRSPPLVLDSLTVPPLSTFEEIYWMKGELAVNPNQLDSSYTSIPLVFETSFYEQDAIFHWLVSLSSRWAKLTFSTHFPSLTFLKKTSPDLYKRCRKKPKEQVGNKPPTTAEEVVSSLEAFSVAFGHIKKTKKKEKSKEHLSNAYRELLELTYLTKPHWLESLFRAYLNSKLVDGLSVCWAFVEHKHSDEVYDAYVSATDFKAAHFPEEIEDDVVFPELFFALCRMAVSEEEAAKADDLILEKNWLWTIMTFELSDIYELSIQKNRMAQTEFIRRAGERRIGQFIKVGLNDADLLKDLIAYKGENLSLWQLIFRSRLSRDLLCNLLEVKGQEYQVLLGRQGLEELSSSNWVKSFLQAQE